MAAIRRRGEAVPGDLAVELRQDRSTLAYNLKRPLKERLIERRGGGRSIRYQAVERKSDSR